MHQQQQMLYKNEEIWKPVYRALDVPSDLLRSCDNLSQDDDILNLDVVFLR